MPKSLYILFAWLSLTLCVTAQSTAINQVINNKKEGLWRSTDTRGKTHEGNYLNGKRIGEWKSTRLDGTVECVVHWENGRPKGMATYYYPNGNIMEQGFWNIDHWEGEYIRNTPSGKKMCEFTYNKNGKRHGRQKYYHANGRVMYDADWQDGKIYGLLAVYDSLGNKTMERTYNEKGEFIGSAQMATLLGETPPVSDEEQEAAANAKEFKGTGTYTVYDNDGRIWKKGYFDKGVLVEGEERKYKNGKLVGITKFQGGQPVKSRR